MEQLKTLDLTRIEAEENIEHTQTMRKKRQDKTLMEGKRCKHCKNPLIIPRKRLTTLIKQRRTHKETKVPNFTRVKRFCGIKG
jgi:hypothetical protein